MTGRWRPPAVNTLLLDLSRALHTTLDPDEVARRFEAHAGLLTGGRARLWLVTDGSELLDALGAVPSESRPPCPEWSRVLETCRPQQAGTDFLAPLLCDGAAIGLIQVAGASPAHLASGGMRHWRAVGELVGAAVANARGHAQVCAESKRFRALVEQMPAVTYVDRAGSGQPVYVSPQLEALTGVAVEEWLTGVDGWSDRVHPDDRERALRLYRRATPRAPRTATSTGCVDEEGGERWFHDQSVIVHDERGIPVEIQGVIHEITDRKRAEQALHESEWRLRVAESRYRSLVEQLPLAIYQNALDDPGTPLSRSVRPPPRRHDMNAAQPDRTARRRAVQSGHRVYPCCSASRPFGRGGEQEREVRDRREVARAGRGGNPSVVNLDRRKLCRAVVRASHRVRRCAGYPLVHRPRNDALARTRAGRDAGPDRHHRHAHGQLGLEQGGRAQAHRQGHQGRRRPAAARHPGERAADRDADQRGDRHPEPGPGVRLQRPRRAVPGVHPAADRLGSKVRTTHVLAGWICSPADLRTSPQLVTFRLGNQAPEVGQ